MALVITSKFIAIHLYNVGFTCRLSFVVNANIFLRKHFIFFDGRYFGVFEIYKHSNTVVICKSYCGLCIVWGGFHFNFFLFLANNRHFVLCIVWETSKFSVKCFGVWTVHCRRILLDWLRTFKYLAMWTIWRASSQTLHIQCWGEYMALRGLSLKGTAFNDLYTSSIIVHVMK